MQVTGGYLKSRKIDSPKGSNVRPTLSQMRESVFSVLFSVMDFDGKSFLDAFAGSGIMGFEAISRGFGSITFIEKDKKTFWKLKDNAQKLDVTADFYLGDTPKLLKKMNCCYDVIYVDPPYMSGLYEDVLALIADRQLLSDGGVIILEHPKSLIISFNGYKMLKQKNYADKTVTFLTV